MAYLYNAPICLHKLYENVCTNAWMYYIHIHSISAIIMVNFFPFSLSLSLFPLFTVLCAMTQQWGETATTQKETWGHSRKKNFFFIFYYSSSDYANIWLIFFCLSFIPFTEWPIKNCNRVEKEHKRSITFSCLCVDERNSELVNNKKCEWVLKC